MTSSIKPELHKVLYCDQRKTKPRRQVACRVKLVKIENVSEICERRNTQTDRDTLIATLQHFGYLSALNSTDDCMILKVDVKVAHTRLPSVGFRS